MNKKKILILGKLPPPYMGPSIATEIILNSSLKNNFDLIHIDTKANDTLSTLGKWRFKKLFRNYSIYLKLFKTVKKEKPDLVWIPISQTTIGFFKDSVFIWISKILKKKTVLHLRGSNFKNWIDKEASYLTVWYVTSVLKKTQGIIVLGNNLRYLFKNIYPDQQIFVVPNGADYKIPIAEKKNEYVNILYLANLQSSKGIEDVIDSLVILKNKFNNKFYATIIGAWRKEETESYCKNMAELHELPLTFLPPTTGSDKFKNLAASDIFVFTPREPEGHPWVIVEAMAAGLPIIATDKGAIIESVIDGTNGFIVQHKRPDQIADKLNYLIENPSVRIAMGKESKQLYEQHFKEKNMVENLTRAFQFVLQH